MVISYFLHRCIPVSRKKDVNENDRFIRIYTFFSIVFFSIRHRWEQRAKPTFWKVEGVCKMRQGCCAPPASHAAPPGASEVEPCPRRRLSRMWGCVARLQQPLPRAVGTSLEEGGMRHTNTAGKGLSNLIIHTKLS